MQTLPLAGTYDGQGLRHPWLGGLSENLLVSEPLWYHPPDFSPRNSSSPEAKCVVNPGLSIQEESDGRLVLYWVGRNRR